jgi:F-type H+-transporting ATPase subunit epsilon
MIEVDIVTPVRKLVEGARATSVRLPAADGQLEILPGHTELLTVLGTGVLVLVSDGVERRFAISYGFAEIRKDRVVILAETSEESKDIDLERARGAQKRAESALVSVLTPEHFRKQELKLQRSLARQLAVTPSH